MTRADPDCPPKWLVCNKPLIPDMLAIDPTKMPVWEITGAQFSKSDIHTAGGISIRFPRITKQRDDKSYQEATSLQELAKLFEASKDCLNLDLLTDGLDDATIDIKTKLQGVGGADVSPKKSPATIKTSPPAIIVTKEDSSYKRDHTEDKTVPSPVKKKLKTRANIDKETKAEKLKPPEKLGKRGAGVGDDGDDYRIKTHKKAKPKYLFNGSSSEEENLAQNPKTAADTHTKTENIANSNTVVVEKQTICGSVGVISANTGNIASISGGTTEVVSKNKDITTISSGSRSGGDGVGVAGVKNSNIKIFENVFLCVADNDLRDCLKEELRYFYLWGGTELSNTNDCTHVLHKNTTIPKTNWHCIRLVFVYVYTNLNIYRIKNSTFLCHINPYAYTIYRSTSIL